MCVSIGIGIEKSRKTTSIFSIGKKWDEAMPERGKRDIKQETSSLHSANVPISIGISFFKVKRLYSG